MISDSVKIQTQTQAEMAATLHSQLKDEGSPFLTIFLDAASQVAQVTQSKLFILLESVDGVR